MNDLGIKTFTLIVTGLGSMNCFAVRGGNKEYPYVVLAVSGGALNLRSHKMESILPNTYGFTPLRRFIRQTDSRAVHKGDIEALSRP